MSSQPDPASPSGASPASPSAQTAHTAGAVPPVRGVRRDGISPARSGSSWRRSRPLRRGRQAPCLLRPGVRRRGRGLVRGAACRARGGSLPQPVREVAHPAPPSLASPAAGTAAVPSAGRTGRAARPILSQTIAAGALPRLTAWWGVRGRLRWFNAVVPTGCEVPIRRMPRPQGERGGRPPMYGVPAEEPDPAGAAASLMLCDVTSLGRCGTCGRAFCLSHQARAGAGGTTWDGALPAYQKCSECHEFPTGRPTPQEDLPTCDSCGRGLVAGDTYNRDGRRLCGTCYIGAGTART